MASRKHQEHGILGFIDMESSFNRIKSEPTLYYKQEEMMVLK
jgi:hypothetical protein